ncbi:hypothetical protein C0J52_26978 [Blattella germanica]|nr:hypothetical protein C0J52_26978 [Blattella germanica]
MLNKNISHCSTGILHHSNLPLQIYASVVLHFVHSALLTLSQGRIQFFSSSFFLFFHLPLDLSCATFGSFLFIFIS